MQCWQVERDSDTSSVTEVKLHQSDTSYADSLKNKDCFPWGGNITEAHTKNGMASRTKEDCFFLFPLNVKTRKCEMKPKCDHARTEKGKHFLPDLPSNQHVSFKGESGNYTTL